jgi:hypothetical protein
MKRLCFIVLAGIMLFSVGCAQNKGESFMRLGYDFTKVDKVAVIDVKGPIRGELVKNQISDFFVQELLRKGYAPIERQQVQLLLKEQKFQASDITTPENAALAGKILNVPVVMTINIPVYDNKMNITAKMLDVQEGGILWTGTGFGSTGKGGATFLGAAIGAFFGAVVAGGDSSDKLGGAVVGGVLGGAAGDALSPQQAEQMQKIVKVVCEKLPPRYVMIKQ